MLESRNCYHMNENPRPAKGWSATIKFVGGYGVNRGCVGFDYKYQAQKWLDKNLERIKGYYGELEFAGVEKVK